MADGRAEHQRRMLVAQAALVWGAIDDVQGFVDSGRVDGPATTGPAPVDADVLEYMQAIERNGGRFLMPEEVYGDGQAQNSSR